VPQASILLGRCALPCLLYTCSRGWARARSFMVAAAFDATLPWLDNLTRNVLRWARQQELSEPRKRGRENGGEQVDSTVGACLFAEIGRTLRSGLELGEPQRFKNLVVLPLFSSSQKLGEVSDLRGKVSGRNDGPKYVTLGQALAKGVLSVTEVHESGSVPELKVVNKGNRRVLLLDGEELVGAKQNRVLNATILLRKESETIVPVSCTEQGRWSYLSKKFADSGVVMSPRMRGGQSEAVAASLAQNQRFQADQDQVWAEIEEMSASAQVRSSTNALRDVFESKTGELEDCLRAFPCLPHQKGLLAIINGEVAGFDFVSREAAYKRLHRKLTKSYALEALLRSGEGAVVDPSSQARAFLAEAAQAKGKRFKSVGHGWDHRIQGDNLVGSALTYRNTVIHAAFFRSTEEQRQERLARARRRREFRANVQQRQMVDPAMLLGPEESYPAPGSETDQDLSLYDPDVAKAATDSET